MKNNTVITISRQFGSGGREIGKQIAKALDIAYYDNELIQKSAEKSGYSKEIFEQAEQKPTGSLLYSMSLFASSGVGFDLPLSDKVFIVQSDVIKEVALQGSCVIVGRCADYVLRDNKNTINIFIHGDLDKRIERAEKEYHFPSDRAKETVIKNDKRRASYYNFYTSLKWGHAPNYDLCINSSILGVQKTAEAICEFLKRL